VQKTLLELGLIPFQAINESWFLVVAQIFFGRSGKPENDDPSSVVY
jgi:hypothetical protein